jgi:hypothetical protein
VKRRACEDENGWCGYCYENVKKGNNNKGHRGYRPPKVRRWEWSDMAITRRSDKGVSQIDTPMSVDCAFGKRYPNIAEFLSRLTWEDGTTRVLGTMLLLVEDGRAKCWLNDKDAGLSCWLSGATVSDALAAAEKVLGGTGGDWRRPPVKGRR